MAATKRRQNQDAFDRALRYFQEARSHHDTFVDEVERRYKAYRGILEKNSKAADWTTKSHPPYLNHIVETTLASLIDDKLRYRIRPRMTLESLGDPMAPTRAKLGAKAHQVLFDWQVRKSRFNWIQRPFALQNAIAGLTVAKTYWTTQQERRRTLAPVEETLLGPDEEPILHPATGAAMTIPRMVERVEMTTIYDGPVTEVRDVRDFLWHEAATSLSNSMYVIDRVRKTKEEILEGYASGVFGPERGGWARKDCEELLSDSDGAFVKEDTGSREQDLFGQDRTKNLIEVIEVWDNRRKTVTTIANRSILLAHREGFPFFHDRPPFVVCSTQPDLFRIQGISQVEKVEHLQTMLWDIANQRIDNIRLLNNAIFWFRPDVEDLDQYKFEPGARWLVDDPAQVNQWAPQAIPAEVSLGTEALLKGDMQNLGGGFPFTSGTDSQTVDQKTATGASIVTSIAQRSIDIAKQELYKAWEEVGHQRMTLNQQFIREPTVAPVLGLDGQEELEVIFPELLKGDFEFEIDAIPDAMMRQEEQASAQAMIQLALQSAPVIAMLAQNGMAKMLNMDAFVEDMLRAFGKEDTDRYFSSQVPPAMPGPGGGGGGQPPVGGQPPMGVTAPQSIDPAVSPSAALSQSPMVLLQRAQALSGGGQNVQKA